VLFDPALTAPLAVLLFVWEIFAGVLIIKRIAYTEIDWIAYMQEVGGFLDGERNYENLRGDTGPLVYPAGFVYIYSLLRFVTNHGENIILAQYIFLGIYLATQALVFSIYARTRACPPLLLVLLCLSKRVHSVYMLRCFNDCIATFFMHAAILILMLASNTKAKTDSSSKSVPVVLPLLWLASLVFSFAISIKMNVLLALPAFGLILLRSSGFLFTLLCVVSMVALQAALAIPFLLEFPTQYLSRAFEFSRVFTYKWTVNFRFLPEDIFVSKNLAIGLIAGHITFLLIFAVKWTQPTPSNKNPQTRSIAQKIISCISCIFSSLIASGSTLSACSPTYIVYTMFASNFVGIVFARTLHYQFYSWYYHTLPFLLYWVLFASQEKGSRLNFALLLRALGVVVGMVVVEWAFNVFPSTPASSLGLQTVHYVLLIALVFVSAPVASLTHNKLE